MKKYHIFLAGYGNPNVMPSIPTFTVEGDVLESKTPRGNPILISGNVVIKRGATIVAVVPHDAAIQIKEIKD